MTGGDDDADRLPLDDIPGQLPESDESDVGPANAAEQQTDNAADPGASRAKHRRLKKSEEQAAEFWRRVFADPVGRREMWQILQAGHCFDTQFACGPTGFPQTEATWFRAGEQQLAQRLYHSWSIFDRAGVFRMLDEHHPAFVRAERIRKRGS